MHIAGTVVNKGTHIFSVFKYNIAYSSTSTIGTQVISIILTRIYIVVKCCGFFGQ